MIPSFGPCGVCGLDIHFGVEYAWLPPGNYCTQCDELLHGHDPTDHTNCYQLHNQVRHPVGKDLHLIGRLTPPIPLGVTIDQQPPDPA